MSWLTAFEVFGSFIGAAAAIGVVGGKLEKEKERKQDLLLVESFLCLHSSVADYPSWSHRNGVRGDQVHRVLIIIKQRIDSDLM